MMLKAVGLDLVVGVYIEVVVIAVVIVVVAGVVLEIVEIAQYAHA